MRDAEHLTSFLLCVQRRTLGGVDWVKVAAAIQASGFVAGAAGSRPGVQALSPGFGFERMGVAVHLGDLSVELGGCPLDALFVLGRHEAPAGKFREVGDHGGHFLTQRAEIPHDLILETQGAALDLPHLADFGALVDEPFLGNRAADLPHRCFAGRLRNRFSLGQRLFRGLRQLNLDFYGDSDHLVAQFQIFRQGSIDRPCPLIQFDQPIADVHRKSRIGGRTLRGRGGSCHQGLGRLHLKRFLCIDGKGDAKMHANPMMKKEALSNRFMSGLRK